MNPDCSQCDLSWARPQLTLVDKFEAVTSYEDPFLGLLSPSEEDWDVEGGFAIIDYPEGDSTEETPSPNPNESQSSTEETPSPNSNGSQPEEPVKRDKKKRKNKRRGKGRG